MSHHNNKRKAPKTQRNVKRFFLINPRQLSLFLNKHQNDENGKKMFDCSHGNELRPAVGVVVVMGL